MTIHPDTAARYTGLAMIGLIICAAFAVGSLIFTLPEPEVEEPEAPLAGNDSGVEDEPPDPEAFQPDHTDWTTLTTRISWLSPEVIEPEEDPEETVASNGEEGDETDEDPETPRVQQGGPPGWRYIGYFGRADSLTALVSIGGVQRIVARGDVVEGYEIESISREELEIAGDVMRHNLEIEAPAGVSLGSASPIGDFGSGGRRGNPARPGGDDLSAIERARQQRLERLRNQGRVDEERSRSENPRR